MFQLQWKTIENSQDENTHNLSNDPFYQPTFLSIDGHSTTSRDLALCTDDAHSYHRPVTLTLCSANGTLLTTSASKVELQENQDVDKTHLRTGND